MPAPEIIMLKDVGLLAKGEKFRVAKVGEYDENIYFFDSLGRYVYLNAIDRGTEWEFVHDDEPTDSVYTDGELLTFDDYQRQARSTAIYPGRETLQGLLYTVLGITGESGEIAEKVKKLLRDRDGHITDDFKKLIEKELGDVLWYISNIASELDLNLEQIALKNLEKLLSRKERGVLKGDGDNR